jgi:hypothetical protein
LFLSFPDYPDSLLVHFVRQYWPEFLLERLTGSYALGKPHMLKAVDRV